MGRMPYKYNWLYELKLVFDHGFPGKKRYKAHFLLLSDPIWTNMDGIVMMTSADIVVWRRRLLLFGYLSVCIRSPAFNSFASFSLPSSPLSFGRLVIWRDCLGWEGSVWRSSPALGSCSLSVVRLELVRLLSVEYSLSLFRTCHDQWRPSHVWKHTTTTVTADATVWHYTPFAPSSGHNLS